MSTSVRTNSKRITVNIQPFNERWCNMCDSEEAMKKRATSQQTVDLAYSNTDRMNYTTSVALCEEHARQMVAALNAGLFEIEWNKNHEVNQ